MRQEIASTLKYFYSLLQSLTPSCYCFDFWLASGVVMDGIRDYGGLFVKLGLCFEPN